MKNIGYIILCLALSISIYFNYNLDKQVKELKDTLMAKESSIYIMRDKISDLKFNLEEKESDIEEKQYELEKTQEEAEDNAIDNYYNGYDDGYDDGSGR